MLKGKRRSQQHAPEGVRLLPVPDHLVPSMFRRLVDEIGGVHRAEVVLRASSEVVARWYSGELEPPFPVLLACWWHGPRGFDEAFRLSHWTHEYNSFLKNEARARVELLEAVITRSGFAVPPGRITSDAQAATIPMDGWLAHMTTVQGQFPERLQPLLSINRESR